MRRRLSTGRAGTILTAPVSKHRVSQRVTGKPPSKRESKSICTCFPDTRALLLATPNLNPEAVDGVTGAKTLYLCDFLFQVDFTCTPTEGNETPAYLVSPEITLPQGQIHCLSFWFYLCGLPGEFYHLSTSGREREVITQ